MSSKEILAIKESLSQLLEHETIKEFASIWDAIGIEDRIRQERRDKMVQYHCNLQLEMLEEERSLKKRLEDSIKSCSEELVQLETQLHLSSSLVRYIIIIVINWTFTFYHFNNDTKLILIIISCFI